MSADPVQVGLAASLAKPGGNATGVTFGLLRDPSHSDNEEPVVRRAAAALGVELHSGPMRGPADLDAPLPPLPGGRTRRQNVLRCSKGRRRAVIAVLRDANQPEIDVELRELEVASDAIGRQILIAKAAGERDFNAAFARIVKAGAGALVVRGCPVFLNNVGNSSRWRPATRCPRPMCRGNTDAHL